jgi:pimeloyl-ACP methyl ester carboxylesterase
MATTNHPGRNFSMDTAPGIRISCFDMGPRDGQPLVILHGLAGSALEFFETARALPEFRTILIDLRGHGRVPPPRMTSPAKPSFPTSCMSLKR